MTKFLNISTDNTLGGNSPSDEIVSSQKAIKEYVDGGFFADKDLSNLSSNGKLVVDGQWITATTTTIASGVSGDNTYSNEFNLSSFLPNDGQIYDCLFYADGRTGTTSGNTIRIYLTTSLITGGVLVVFGNTRTSSSGFAGGACIIPVGTNRKVTMSLDYTGGTATHIELRLAGYRRIGTNS